MAKEIGNPWAVYHTSIMSPLGFGRVVHETERCLDIEYTQDHVPIELWNPLYVKRFGTPLEAIDYYSNHSELTAGEAELKFLRSFPNQGEKLEETVKSAED